MSVVEGDDEGSTAGRASALVRGREDTRVRATWRVLLAVPLLWFLTGAVLTGNAVAVLRPVLSGTGVSAGLAQSLLHAGFFLALFVPWARYLDCRPLSDYGVSATPRWAGELLLGGLAVQVGFALWYGLGAAMGWTTLSLAPPVPLLSLAAALVLAFVTFVLHAAVQEVVFFRVVLRTAAEGWRSRGLATPRAVAAGLAVTLPLFLAIHELTALRALDLVVAGIVFGLLYVHTGELALSTGAHFGSLYSMTVFSTGAAEDARLFAVDQALPAALDALAYGYPKVVVAYALLVGYLWWRDGDVGIALDLDEPREA